MDTGKTMESVIIDDLRLMVLAKEQVIQRLEKQKDQAYRERDIILATYCRFIHEFSSQNIFTTYRTKHDPSDAGWEDDWRNIIVIEYVVESFGFPGLVAKTVQMAWHVHDSEMVMFSFLPEKPNTWDGHTTKQKYNRLLDVIGVLLPYQIDLTKEMPE